MPCLLPAGSSVADPNSAARSPAQGLSFHCSGTVSAQGVSQPASRRYSASWASDGRVSSPEQARWTQCLSAIPWEEQEEGTG